MRVLEASRIESIVLGTAAATVQLRAEIERAAVDDLSSLLVMGETGTGKDLVPRALVAAGVGDGHLEVFSCPAVPADHLESELFGTTRGCYPGALDRPGAVERAQHGVLFLDEGGALSERQQAKLLRFLETREGRRLGAPGTYTAPVAVVAATNQNLAALAHAGRFRPDLYYRLVQDGVLVVPPLRDRVEDIPILAQRFLAELRPGLRLESTARAALRQASWPGNVRELRAVVRAAARAARGRAVTADHVLEAKRRISLCADSRLGAGSGTSPDTSFYRTPRALRRAMLIDALTAARGNRTRAGIALGFHCARDGSMSRDALRARKLAHRKFCYWWARLVESDANAVGSDVPVLPPAEDV